MVLATLKTKKASRLPRGEKSAAKKEVKPEEAFTLPKEASSVKKSAPATLLPSHKTTEGQRKLGRTGSTSPKKSRLGGTSKKEEPISRLRIRIRAYEYKILDLSVKQIIDTALRYDAKVVGPIPLPTEIKKYTVNRSPFIYKNAREQFEMRVHKRVIDVINPSPKVMESLTNLSLPSGVNIDVKIM